MKGSGSVLWPGVVILPGLHQGNEELEGQLTHIL